MAKDLFWTLVTFGIIVAMLVLAFWPTGKSEVVVVEYNCARLIDQSHPDMPVKVQEECRKRELNK